MLLCSDRFLRSVLHKRCLVPPEVGSSRPASPKPASQWAPARGVAGSNLLPGPARRLQRVTSCGSNRSHPSSPPGRGTGDGPRQQRRAPGPARTHFPGGGSRHQRALRPTRRADVAEGRQSARERPARACALGPAARQGGAHGRWLCWS